MTREELESYDVFVPTLPGVAIGVRTADCVPVLLSGVSTKSYGNYWGSDDYSSVAAGFARTLSASRMARIAMGMVRTITTSSIGMLSMTGIISWS